MSSTQGPTEDEATLALGRDEEAAWRAAARLLVALPRVLEADLAAGSGLGVAQYTVLMHLSEAPGRRLRIGELAQRVALSSARTSRAVDDLGRGGLVRRATCPGDGRAVLAELTDAGLQRLRDAWPVHLASVRARVMDHATADELTTVATVLARVLDALGPPGCADGRRVDPAAREAQPGSAGEPCEPAR